MRSPGHNATLGFVSSDQNPLLEPKIETRGCHNRIPRGERRRLDMVVITVAGKLNDAHFQQCKKAAEFIATQIGGIEVDVKSLLPADYDLALPELMVPFYPEVRKHNGAVLCHAGAGRYIGGRDAFMAYCETTFGYTDRTHPIFYERLAKTHMREYVAKTGREYVQMEVSIGGEVEGKLLIELFTDHTPKTCANFKALVKGGHDEIPDGAGYTGCLIHQVMAGGWFQTGDVVKKDGTGEACCIYGESFGDECFRVKHDKPGILAMASAKRNKNGCQFYVTQCVLDSLDGKRVGFGRVIDGLRLMKIIDRVETDPFQRPKQPVKIENIAMWTPQPEEEEEAKENEP